MIRAGDTLLVATRNQGKTKEFAGAFAPLGVRVVDLTELRGVSLPPIVEDGATFADNALIKARTIAEATGWPVLADDSGLCVDRLDGRPGVRSARYAGEDADDARNNELLIRELRAAVPDAPPGGPWSTARFVCALALYDPSAAKTVFAEGSVEGEIVAPAGSGGFGYDPLFRLPEYGRTMAELTVEEKNRISHRGRALRLLLEKLRQPGAGDQTIETR